MSKLVVLLAFALGAVLACSQQLRKVSDASRERREAGGGMDSIASTGRTLRGVNVPFEPHRPLTKLASVSNTVVITETPAVIEHQSPARKSPDGSSKSTQPPDSAEEVTSNWAWQAPPDSPRIKAMMAKKTLDEDEMPSIETGPWMPKWKNTVAICTVMKEENATDVREWLMYHRWLGVDRVYIYEHFTTSPLAEHPALEELMASGFLHYQQADTFGRQGDLNHHCLLKHRNKVNWMAFIDADEYIVLRKTGEGMLKKFLEGYKYFGGLSINWIMMGWSEHETRPVHGGVMRHYTQCNPEPSKIIKTIVNTWYSLGGHGVHNSWYRGYSPSVNEHRIAVPLICKQKTKEDWKRAPRCAMKPARSIDVVEDRTVDKIALFHFFSKSREDYQIKMNKGLAAGATTRTMEHFNRLSVKNQEWDVPMCQELARVSEECCPEW